MSTLFVIWWWYFDGASGASERSVSNSRDAIKFHIWSYAHFPLYLGLVVAGVGIREVVTTASRTTMEPVATLILMGAATLVMVTMTVISATSSSAPNHRTMRWRAHLALAAATLALGATGKLTTPVAVVISLTTLCVMQLALSLARSSPDALQRQVASLITFALRE
jgi:low temperature requirement protein LtrA